MLGDSTTANSAALSRIASVGEIAGRLLYVEDNMHVAEMTILMLEDAGMEIVQAISAEDALRIVDRDDRPFDMVLTDIVMPGLSGVQLARRLSRRWPDMPIVLMSGYSDELVAGYGSQYELLQKPFTRGALLACIERRMVH